MSDSTNKVKIPSFVAEFIQDWEEREYEAHEMMYECLSGVKLSNNRDYMIMKAAIYDWLEEDKENLVLLSKAIVYGFEVEK